MSVAAGSVATFPREARRIVRWRGRGPLWLCHALLALAVPATASAVAPVSVPVATFPDSVFVRADRFLRQGAADSVLALAGPVVERATAARDLNLELRARLLQAGGLALLGRLQEAEQSARRARELAEQLSLPGPGRTARRWLGYALLGQGRADEARDVYTGLRDDARAAGDGREEAYALLGLSYRQLARGEAAGAQEGYERAAALFEAAGEHAIALEADIGLARALGAEGRYREMCRLYEKVIRVGSELGQARAVGYALNNLGSYEYQAGDPGRAVDYWERTLAARRKSGNPAALVTPGANLAMALTALVRAAAPITRPVRSQNRPLSDSRYRITQSSTSPPSSKLRVAARISFAAHNAFEIQSCITPPAHPCRTAIAKAPLICETM